MKYFFIGLLVMTSSLSAMADAKSVGCGFGGVIAPRNSLVSASTRVVINQFTSTTFAMSTGTSGCAAHTIAEKDKAAVLYADVNYDALEMEMAQGQGEFLNGWASVLGCQQEAFGRATQTHYNQLVPSSEKNPIKLLNNVQELIRTSADFAGACRAELT